MDELWGISCKNKRKIYHVTTNVICMNEFRLSIDMNSAVSARCVWCVCVLGRLSKLITEEILVPTWSSLSTQAEQAEQIMELQWQPALVT